MKYSELSRALLRRLELAAETNSGRMASLFDDAIQNACRSEVRRLVDDSLSRFGAARERLSLPEIAAYEQPTAIYLLAVLSWAWHNGLELTEGEMREVAQSVCEATLGYRLLDVHLDHGKLGPEAVALGMYLIRSHEHRLMKIFGPQKAAAVVRQYADAYASVEYIEKSHRWKTCPFECTEAHKIGLKAAPAFAIFHLMFLRSGKQEAEVERLSHGLCAAFAAIQMADDLADAVEDLGNGTETLVVSGFYLWSEGRAVTREVLREFFDGGRLRRYMRATLDLFNEAARAFESEGDQILLLVAEHRKHEFLRKWTERLASAKAVWRPCGGEPNWELANAR
jgi:hypothetical protein